jgi:6-pyruvoyltetrahydropterin/6-carboxytetrahydropterin synthase
VHTEVSREYFFESAHYLPNVPEGHKCKRMHGHHYVFVVRVGDTFDWNMGWILDFWDLDAIIKPLVDQVDHQCLNDIPGLENPTAEIISQWLLVRIQKGLPRGRVLSVEVFETPQASAITYS